MREDLHLIQGVNFLRKPYDTAALLKAVRHCLDGPAYPQPQTPAATGPGPMCAARWQPAPA